MDKLFIPYCQTLARTVHKAVGHPKPLMRGFSTANCIGYWEIHFTDESCNSGWSRELRSASNEFD